LILLKSTIIRAEKRWRRPQKKVLSSKKMEETDPNPWPLSAAPLRYPPLKSLSLSLQSLTAAKGQVNYHEMKTKGKSQRYISPSCAGEDNCSYTHQNILFLLFSYYLLKTK
jgi:hypothetical protein